MAILPAWVANQNTEFALSSPATESAIIYILHVIKSVLPKSEIKKIYIRGVLQISSDGDDWMGAKIKTKKKSLGLPKKPPKNPWTKI